MRKRQMIGYSGGARGRYLGMLVLAVLALFAAAELSGLAEAQANTAGIATRDTIHLGTILTDASGRTLYVLTGDQPNSSCRGDCAREWPPALLDSGSPAPAPNVAGSVGVLAREAGSVGVLAREDGRRQLTYNNQPLYYSRRDQAPGDIHGHGVDGMWRVANVTPTVRVQNHPELGEILVGPNGMTLYTSTRDPGDNTSRCVEGCLAHWPPLTVGYRPAPPPGLERRLESLSRNWLDDERVPELMGAIHVTYQGKPLHYWSRDEAPGDVTGHGVGDAWFVARP